MADNHFDIIVIGGGPGGYVGAIRAAQLGYKAAIIDRAKLGGVCLNWGCIPSKALLSNAELMEKLAHKQDWGLTFGDVSFDWDKVIGRSRDVAAKLNKGVEFLMKKNKVEHITAHAKVVKGATGGTPCEVELYDCEVNEELTSAPAKPASKPTKKLTAGKVIIATGSVARDLPFAKFDGKKIWGAREAMYNKERPESLLVIGSGAIGMEFGYFYHQFGTKVTVVEMLDRILPVEDEDISKAMLKHFKKQGMEFHLGHTLTAADTKGKKVKATIAPFKDGKADESKAQTLEADRILLAIGVQGRFDGLFDDKLGLETAKGHIKTDYVPLGPGSPTEAKALSYKTNISGVYAIGDVIGPPWLAHVASEEAILCVERIAFSEGKLNHEPIPMDYTVIPGCTYCNPQVASVGFTEQALKQRGLKKGEDYEVGQFPFTALGKAIATQHTEGFVKIIRGLPRGEILGAHIMGDSATELIAEFSLARRMEATTEELIATVHAHPTMHESVHEAALASEGRAIHT
ncbi:MAG: dihydrolipoyl dehydrogenase [Phycisphaeraceae bacterium]|nr:MAG: dihydrolipoyl dehydrogenase [Phycisphaeraceae bacterium]